MRCRTATRAPCDQAGEVCPLARSLSSGQRERAVHLHYGSGGELYESIDLSPVRNARGEITHFVEKLEEMPVAKGLAHAQGLVGRSPRSRRCLSSWPALPSPMPACSCRENPAPARNWWPRPSTMPAPVRAPLCGARLLRHAGGAVRERVVRLRARRLHRGFGTGGTAWWRQLAAARCFWTRWATSPTLCR